MAENREVVVPGGDGNTFCCNCGGDWWRRRAPYGPVRADELCAALNRLAAAEAIIRRVAGIFPGEIGDISRSYLAQKETS